MEANKKCMYGLWCYTIGNVSRSGKVSPKKASPQPSELKGKMVSITETVQSLEVRIDAYKLDNTRVSLTHSKWLF